MRETGHHQMINTWPLTVTERKSLSGIHKTFVKMERRIHSLDNMESQRASPHPPSFDSSSSIMIQPVGGIAPDSSAEMFCEVTRN